MKRIALVLLLATGLVGCKEFDGQFEVLEQITLKEYHLFGKDRREFGPGDYAATLVPVAKDEFKIKVNRQGKIMSFKFEVPNHSVPSYHGDFHIPASQINKQNYGIAGRVDTDVSEGPEQYGNESCSETFVVTVCTCNVDSEGRAYRSCNNEYETIWGNQDVRYFKRHTHTMIDAELLSKSDDAVAVFKGDHYDIDKIYTFQSRCMLNRRPPRDRGTHRRCHGRRDGRRGGHR